MRFYDNRAMKNRSLLDNDDFYSPDNIAKRYQKIEDAFDMPKEEGWEPSDFGEKSFIKNKDKDNEMFIQYNGADYDGDNQDWVAGYMRNGGYVRKKFANMEDAKDFLSNSDNEYSKKMGLARETLLNKFNDAHLYNDGRKFQLVLSNGKTEEFDTYNDAIDRLSEYSKKDYSWAKKDYEEEKSQKEEKKDSLWVCANWPTDPSDRSQLNQKLKSLGLYATESGKDAIIHGNRQSIEKFMSYLGVHNRSNEIHDADVQRDD